LRGPDAFVAIDKMVASYLVDLETAHAQLK